MARYLYSELSNLIQARQNCADIMNGFRSGDGNNAQEWFHRHEETIDNLVQRHMPSGSGFDSGTALDFDASHADKLVFHTSFHHMNEAGYYDGWTAHKITITPSLSFGFHVRVSGRNRNDIKDYISECFANALRTDITPESKQLAE